MQAALNEVHDREPTDENRNCSAEPHHADGLSVWSEVDAHDKAVEASQCGFERTGEGAQRTSRPRRASSECLHCGRIGGHLEPDVDVVVMVALREARAAEAEQRDDLLWLDLSRQPQKRFDRALGDPAVP